MRRITGYFMRIAACALFMAMLFMGVFAKRGWLDWQRMHEQNHKMDVSIAEAQFQLDELLQQIERLKNLPLEQEKAIRKVLGYVRKNDMVVEF